MATMPTLADALVIFVVVVYGMIFAILTCLSRFFFASLLIPIMCVNLMKNIKSLYSEYSFTVCHSTIFPKIVYMIN